MIQPQKVTWQSKIASIFLVLNFSTFIYLKDNVCGCATQVDNPNKTSSGKVRCTKVRMPEWFRYHVYARASEGYLESSISCSLGKRQEKFFNCQKLF